MPDAQTTKPNFFSLPYDIRRLIYENLFSGRCFASLETTNEHSHSETFICSSDILDEATCLFIHEPVAFKAPDMRLLRTCKTFYDEASAVARQLWFKTYQDKTDTAELAGIADLIRTPPVEAFGRLSSVRLLKEASLRYEGEQLQQSGAWVFIVPPEDYRRRSQGLTTNDPSMNFKSRSEFHAWASECLDELDFIMYEGVLRTALPPPALKDSKLVPLQFFGPHGTGKRWLTQDVWIASDPENLHSEYNPAKLRASLAWTGEN